MPPSNPTPPPGGGSQTLSLDPASLRALADLVEVLKKNATAVTAVTASGGSRGRVAKPFEEQVAEGIAARQKRQVLNDAIGSAINPPKSFDQQVQQAIASKQSSQSLRAAVNSHFDPSPLTFDQQVQQTVDKQQSRRALKDAVSARLDPPKAAKTFDQEVEEGIAARQKRQALNSAISSAIIPTGRTAAGSQPPAAGHGGGLGGLLGGMGLPPALAGPLAAYAGIRHMAEVSKTIARTQQDEYLTQGQKGRALFKGIVPGGESILDWHDTVSGRKRDMERVGEESGRMDIRTQAATAWGAERYGMQSVADHYQARAATLGNSQATLMPNIDRSTGSGEREYEIASRMLPLRERAARADRESAIANSRVEMALKQQAGLREDGVRLATEEARLAKRLVAGAPGAPSKPVGVGENGRNADGSREMSPISKRIAGSLGFGPDSTSAPEGAERLDLLKKQEQVYARQLANAELQKQSARDVVSRQGEAGLASAEAKKARAGLLRGQGDIAEYNASTAANTAVRLTGLGMGGRMQAKMHFEMAKAHPELLAMDPTIAEGAMSYMPQETRKMLEREGQKLPEYQEAIRQGYADVPLKPGESIAGERKRGTDLKNEASTDELAADGRAAKVFAETYEKLFLKLAEINNREMDKRIANYETKLKEGRSHQ